MIRAFKRDKWYILTAQGAANMWNYKVHWADGTDAVASAGQNCEYGQTLLLKIVMQI